MSKFSKTYSALLSEEREREKQEAKKRKKIQKLIQKVNKQMGWDTDSENPFLFFKPSRLPFSL